MNKRLRTILLILLSVAGLWRCSEPTGPITPPPKLEPPEDSTSHAYTWEYFVLGEFGSGLSAIAADSDTNAWAVGDVELGYEIPTTPGGRMLRKANAFHITPRGIEPYAIELDEWGMRSYSALRGVTVHGGYPTFWGSLSWTKMLKDSLYFYRYEDWAALAGSHNYFKVGNNDDVYLYGSYGFLGRFSSPAHKSRVQIPTGTSKTLKAFTQVGPNEFYIGGWTTDSAGGIFHHLKDGHVMPIRRETGSAFPITYATALWSSKDRLHAVCPDFIYMQSLDDAALWDTLHIPPPTPERIVGLPVCTSGRADNDVFYAGHYGTVLHYNGRNLHFYDEIPRRFPNGAVFVDISITTKHVFLAGYMNNYAILVKGTRIAQ